jgi:hypothetical protein
MENGDRQTAAVIQDTRQDTRPDTRQDTRPDTRQDTRPEIIISEPVKHGDGTSGFISYLVSSNYSVTAFNHSPTTSTHLQVRRRYDELINL